MCGAELQGGIDGQFGQEVAPHRIAVLDDGIAIAPPLELEFVLARLIGKEFVLQAFQLEVHIFPLSQCGKQGKNEK